MQVVRLSLRGCTWYIFHILMTLDMLKRQDMHFYLPWNISDLYISDKYCYNLQLLMGSDAAAPHASGDQITKASALINRLELKDFSVFQFSNPGTSIFIWKHIINNWHIIFETSCCAGGIWHHYILLFTSSQTESVREIHTSSQWFLALVKWI